MIKSNYIVSSRTDIGLLREYNEDGFFICDLKVDISRLGLLVGVADGMGGHNGGDVASRLAIETLASFYGEVEGQKPEPERLMERLVAVVKKANEIIYRTSLENDSLGGMGTTLTAAVFRGVHVFIAHVGDSRAYVFRQGRLIQITDDHSLVAQAVREGILTPEQAARHPQRNIITRALGTREDVEVDEVVAQVEPGDIWLFSSDGLHGFVSDEELRDILSRAGGRDLDDVVDDLVQSALEKGGPDNVTVVLVNVTEEGAGGGR